MQTTKQTPKGMKTILELIKETQEEKKLLALAYTTLADIYSKQITVEAYVDCMLLLSKKLGFGVTEGSLAKASKKYL